MSSIAFIGLGNMGGGMAANLIGAGHRVHAFDLSAEAVARAEAAGCTIASSAAAAADGAEVIVTMLPTGRHVSSVYDEILPRLVPGVLMIDCSTIDVQTAVNASGDAALRGLAVVDAPVSGGITAAAAGTLTFMVGGSREAFEAARPILADMGRTVIHAGSAGAGQAAKACNNMILASTMAATCEAFVLAERLGLDAQAFYDIASVSSGQSWSMTSYCPVAGVGPTSPADRNFEGGFAASLMLKDLGLALEAAHATSVATPMAERASAIYRRFVDEGEGGRDFSGIIRAFAEDRSVNARGT